MDKDRNANSEEMDFGPDYVTLTNEEGYEEQFELVDTVDLARAVLADPAFCSAVLEDKTYNKCFGCPRCQYGPAMPHKCPAGGGI